jgi:outer membrane biosynthesis protein TonB
MAQQDAATSPTVTAFDCPTYPPKAESMRLQGMVVLQVTTDGHQVVDVKLTSGHPMLAPDAIKNVRTWKFADHTPTTFAVEYLYVNQGHFKRDKATKCAAKTDLPSKVTVSTSF